MRDVFSRLLDFCSPRGRGIWLFAIAAGCVFRVLLILVYRNPLDQNYSDCYRHWDNAKHFLNPGPQGSANPYLYQAWLYGVQQITRENKLAIGLVQIGLTLSSVLFWHLFARALLKRPINALRFTTVLTWLPSQAVTYTFFLNETLFMPLLGVSLWLTWKSRRERSPGFFILAAFLWVSTILTRSVALPLAVLCLLYCWWPQRGRRIVLALPAAAIAFVMFAFAGMHAYPHLHRYTAFGDGLNVGIYFVSGARDYKVAWVENKKVIARYIFSSPSFYVHPFEPLSNWNSSREGVVTFTLNRELAGEDLRKTFRKELEKNLDKMPRLVFENAVFLSFSHAWPMASKGPLPARLALWERWIWFPLILLSTFRCARYLIQRRLAFMPFMTLIFMLSLYAAPTVMEGRYRKPLEPLLLLAILWAGERLPTLWRRRR